MDVRTSLAAVAFALGAAVAAPAVAGPVTSETGPDLVKNGGFETGDFTGWTTSIDPAFSGVDGVAAHTGSFGAYFGDAGTPGSISQAITTFAGANYNIHLWLRSDGLTPNSLEVLWGATTVYRATGLPAFGYTEIVIDPLATAGTMLLELRARNDQGFLEIDDVSVRLVPEPTSLALLLPGLLGVVTRRRRKA